MSHYGTLTFDMGYTLVHFYPSEEDLYLAAFRSVGLAIDRQALRQARDAVWREYLASMGCTTFEATEERDREIEERILHGILEHLGFEDTGRVPHLYAACKAAFRVPGAVRVYPEVREVLRALKQRGCRLGVISNWSWDLHDYLDLVGLSGYFDVVLASARAGCEKPHPDIFRQTLQALDCLPEQALHVGDSYEADVVGARSLGMAALWLDRARAGGHADCHTIHDLTGVLDYAPAARRR